MRSMFGSMQYGREILPMHAFNEAAAIEDFNPKLSESVSFGTDVRTLYQWLSVDHSSSFFEMEGELYLNVQLNKFLSVYLDKGLYQGFQVFGMLNFADDNFGIKIGNFLPAFGTRVDDHTAYHRQGVPGVLDLPFGAHGEDTGVEAFYSPDHLLFTAGVYNGVSGGTGGLSTAGFGRTHMAYVLRGEYNSRLFDDVIGLNAGASYYANRDFNQEYTNLKITGIFGGIDLLKTVTVEAELDAVSREPLASPASVTGRIVYIEGNVLVIPGIDLKVQYDFADPDIDMKSGTYSRIGGGAEIFILSGMELRPEYRITTDLTGKKTEDFLAQVLFYF